MPEFDGLWVHPVDLDPELDPETMDPSDEQLLRDYEAALDACRAASQTLWALSGRKFHLGSVTDEVYDVDTTPLGSYVITSGGYALDPSSGVYLVPRDDWSQNRIRLTGQPVLSITGVKDLSTGDIISGGRYYMENRSVLRFSFDISGGVAVSYTYGQKPPITGIMAALALAKQFYLLWSGREEECELPDRVTSVNRQGVSWVLLDNQDFLDDLKTGVYAVDLFLRQVNPDKARLKAKVFSVDIPRGRRRSL